MIKKIWAYVIIIILLIPVIWPLIQPGFFITDDGGWMVIRLSAFHQTLRSGQFPVRFLETLNHGYGYPVPDFNYPLPFYLGSVVHLLGFGFVDSVKILFLASFILGGLFMYRYAGLVAAIVYSYAPYRIFDVYKRGSLGEAVSFIFLPLIFLFLDKGNIFLASIFTAALITSHNIVAFLFLPVIFLYILFKKYPKKRSAVYLLISLSLSAWFWLPAVYDLQFTRTAQTIVAKYSNYFLSSDNFLSIGGLATVLILSLSLYRKKISFFLIVAIVSILFTLPISTPIWKMLPLPRLVQYPWRFLTLTIFSIAIIAGDLAKTDKRLGYLIITSTILLSLPFIHITKTTQPESYYTTNDDTTTIKNEYMPKWVTTDPSNKPDKKIIILPDGKTAQINTVYFPGWEVYVNGVKTPINIQTNGLLRVTINSPGDKITTVFKETPIRIFADLLSVFAAVVSVIFLFKLKE